MKPKNVFLKKKKKRAFNPTDSKNKLWLFLFSFELIITDIPQCLRAHRLVTCYVQNDVKIL